MPENRGMWNLLHRHLSGAWAEWRAFSAWLKPCPTQNHRRGHRLGFLVSPRTQAEAWSSLPVRSAQGRDFASGLRRPLNGSTSGIACKQAIPLRQDGA